MIEKVRVQLKGIHGDPETHTTGLCPLIRNAKELLKMQAELMEEKTEKMIRRDLV
jgi:hypothetical protein